ncbi:MAG: hypothetical protein DRI32_05170 [Chloroflexi bacterium]|nr:MAG: hypothetical protein DRI32_05170 [Chloroflexota bacterium]
MKIETSTKKILNKYLGYPLRRRRVVTSVVVFTILLFLFIWTSYINQEKVLLGVLIAIWIGFICFLTFASYTKEPDWQKKWSSNLCVGNSLSKEKEKLDGIYGLLAVIMLLFPPLAAFELLIEKGLLTLGEKLLPILAKDKGLRRRSLYTATILFTTGIVLQFIGTF